MEQVILVDENDNEVGVMEKMAAHKEGLLHRAFSVLLFNSKGELLLQKRADDKYHSAGLWTNTCCSHPIPGETIESAAQRRLKQEMGIDLLPEFVFKFIYRTELNGGLTEHELDYVLLGIYEGEPDANPDEVSDWKYVDLESVRKELKSHPEKYTHWFKLILEHPDFSKSMAQSTDL